MIGTESRRSYAPLIRKSFHFFLAVRFWTEYLDAKLGLILSPLISVNFLLLAVIAMLSGRVRLDRNLRLLTIWWAAFIGSAIVSSLVELGGFGGGAGQQIYKYLTLLSITYMFCSLYTRPEHLRGLLIALLIGMIPSVAFAIYQGVTLWGFQAHTDEELIRAFGLGTHPVLFGVQIVLIIAILAGTWRRVPHNYLSRRLMLIFLVLALPGLYLTYARTAWVMLAWVGAYALFINGGKHGRFVGFLAIGFGIMALPLFADRFSDLAGIVTLISEGSVFEDPNGRFDSSVHWRIYNWYLMISTGTEQWLLGNGPAQAEILSAFERSSHSSVVDVFVEQGIIGVSSLAGTVIAAFRSARSVRHSPYLANAWQFSVINATLLMVLFAASFSISILNQTLNMILVTLLIVFKYRLVTFPEITQKRVVGIK